MRDTWRTHRPVANGAGAHHLTVTCGGDVHGTREVGALVHRLPPGKLLPLPMRSLRKHRHINIIRRRILLEHTEGASATGSLPASQCRGPRRRRGTAWQVARHAPAPTQRRKCWQCLSLAACQGATPSGRGARAAASVRRSERPAVAPHTTRPAAAAAALPVRQRTAGGGKMRRTGDRCTRAGGEPPPETYPPRRLQTRGWGRPHCGISLRSQDESHPTSVAQPPRPALSLSAVSQEGG